MLNDDKIRLMNEIALFEKKERKRELKTFHFPSKRHPKSSL